MKSELGIPAIPQAFRLALLAYMAVVSVWIALGLVVVIAGGLWFLWPLYIAYSSAMLALIVDMDQRVTYPAKF